MTNWTIIGHLIRSLAEYNMERVTANDCLGKLSSENIPKYSPSSSLYNLFRCLILGERFVLDIYLKIVLRFVSLLKQYLINLQFLPH